MKSGGVKKIVSVYKNSHQSAISQLPGIILLRYIEIHCQKVLSITSFDKNTKVNF
jgi:hypothetical protein